MRTVLFAAGMTLYLVRHAVAVGRSDWSGPDRQRPLTKKGERQALGLVDLLAHAEIHRVATSPAVRCRDTVAPLASKFGLTLHDADELAEGAKAKEAVEYTYRLAAKHGDSVLCTHGDLVPEILRRLSRDGMSWDGDLRFPKGCTWALSWDGERFTSGQYLPPSE
jgi:phosphohistidine phosphatase SixA